LREKKRLSLLLKYN